MRRKNVRLDLILGSRIKQRIGIASAIAAQPMVAAREMTMAARVTPCKLVDCFVGRGGVKDMRAFESTENECGQTLPVAD